MPDLTPEACRAARAILKWSIRELASKAGLAPITVFVLERGDKVAEATQTKIVDAFRHHDVEILAKGARRVH